MPILAPKPYWETTDKKTVRLYHGSALRLLRVLPPKSVHTVITSPPYWGLRDYEGEPEQLGSEPTPEEYLANQVAVFREVHRVLRDDGTLWLNMGDTYSGGWKGGNDREEYPGDVDGSFNRRASPPKQALAVPIPSGNLMGMPWRLALALQADGWVLRQDNIWHKPSPMPESVYNRCTKAHEYVFLLTKVGAGYYYDAEAIKEDSTSTTDLPWDYEAKKQALREGLANYHVQNGTQEKRNKRSVWKIASQGYPGAHFATFPPKLVEPCILAGTSEKGACGRCGAPVKRVTEKEKLYRERPNEYVKRTGEEGTGNSCANNVAGVRVHTLGWKPSCDCKASTVPCTVLDPYMGSGTTASVALEHGRRAIGVELSEKYLVNTAIGRISGTLYSIPKLAHLVPGAAEVEAVSLGESITK